MSNKKRCFTVFALAVVLLTSLILQVSYQPVSAVATSTIKSIKTGAWSEPAVWNTGKVPSWGDNVSISRDTVVTYDLYSTNDIGNMTIYGKLTFSHTKSTNLDVGNIEVASSGVLEIGTPDAPITAQNSVRIRFVMNEPGQNGLMIMGQGEIHGAPVKHTFTKLDSDAKRGSSNLVVADDLQDWNVGSGIVISTTGKGSCTEMNSILAINGRSVMTEKPLICYHSGKEPARADVALLTHNVVITSKDPKLRGHTMFMHDARGGVSYAEFVNLGPENMLGKYPVHFHNMSDASIGMYVQGISVWNSTNRWITIHSSNGITLKDNVGFNTIGHGYFLEHGDEVFNTLDHNIGILNRKGSLVPSDDKPAIFWLENPLNKLSNNIAVEGDYYGFKYDVPDRVQDIGALYAKVNLRSLPILQAYNNEAHDNKVIGFYTSAGASDGSEEQIPASSTIRNLVSWRNGTWGLALFGRETSVIDSLFIDNISGGIAFLGDDNTVTTSHVIGNLDGNGWPAFAGVVFVKGKNNVLSDSVVEKHDSSTLQPGADVRVGSTLNASGDVETTGSIINTEMLSSRAIIFGYPLNSSTHLTVQNYIAPNDNHSKLPSNFTLWGMDSGVANAMEDKHFSALIKSD